MKREKSFYTTITLILFLMASCVTTGTTVTSVWKDASYAGGGFKKMLVIGAAEKHAVRKFFENEFTGQLKEKGIDAIPSYKVLPTLKKLDKETITSMVKELKADSVLVTRLLYRETASQYFPKGKAYVTTPGYYDDYTEYVTKSIYASSANANQLVHLETNLYDARNEKRIWSALSSTFVEGSPNKEIKAFIDLMINNLSEEILL
jgi:hypothetical protein